MQSNTTLQNITYTGCQPDLEILTSILLSIMSVSSVFSFVGNLVVILTVYKNKELRTALNYFIVNMSVSDILFPLFFLFRYLFSLNKLGYVSQFAGNMFCKLLPFFSDVSCGVSMSSLVVITVYRFSAVMFPMRARVENKRKRILVLLLTWAIPIAVDSPYLVYRSFHEKRRRCYYTFTFKHLRTIWVTVGSSLFFFLPLLIMLVLYPVILIKLRQHKLPGNANRTQAVIRRRKQNLRITMMFIVISTAFVLTWGNNIVFYLISYYLPTFRFKIQQPCAVFYFLFFSPAFTTVFHAINPMIYYVFCSSFREGLKQTFSCCRAAGDEQLPAANNIQLHVIPQA